jgi:putative chitinase
MPTLHEPKLSEYREPLEKAMTEAEIEAPYRAAAFLAQLGHESYDLRFFEELATGEAYEMSKGLGNVKPGDGRRYKGRGPIQLTGRSNYRAAGLALGLPLEEDPELAATPDVGFRVAVWFWKTRGLNAVADKLSSDLTAFDTITRRINGGLNGKDDRDRRYRKCLQVMSTPTVIEPR